MTMKTNTTVIKNRKDTATLGEDFTVEIQGGPWTYKAGLRTLAKNVMGNGLYIVEGHGTGHVIPRKLFTKFNRTWDEVTIKTVGGEKVTTTVNKKEDVTAEYLAHFTKDLEACIERENAEIRGALRRNIAYLRKTIKFVTKGEAAEKLAVALAELETLKVKA